MGLSIVNTSGNPSAAHANDPVLARAIQKVIRHVLPLFVIMFIVNYIDRVNIGFVRSHMEHDLGIGAAAYGFGAGLFFIGYALFEVPSNMLLQKVGARIWLTRIMFTWGITATLMAFILMKPSLLSTGIAVSLALTGLPALAALAPASAPPAVTDLNAVTVSAKLDQARNALSPDIGSSQYQITQDKAGQVERIAQCIAEHGGNWLESRMSRMAGHVLLDNLRDGVF